MHLDSVVFLYAFLPATLVGFHLAGRLLSREAAWLLVIATSVGFYYLCEPKHVPLLLGSALFNFVLGGVLERRADGPTKQLALAFGVAVNLAVLGYFKYTGFLVSTLDDWFGLGFQVPAIALPVAISFFTFQQIAYLVDAHRGLTRGHRFIDYLFFITFFPQLLAGPIVHHAEILPQLHAQERVGLRAAWMMSGLSTLVIGLVKKVVLADGIAEYATPIFAAASAGESLTLIDGWIGSLSYTLQLYFDFSGYSDMAIGLGMMFGLRLPLNFDAPYKATNIIDFWRRWHITLSRFLRDYLYVPLGGNRKGRPRRYLNLMLTMALGGLWHGAGWTFVLWGVLHGLYLCINHGFRALAARLAPAGHFERPGYRLAFAGLTFLSVVVAWVFFRAENVTVAMRVLGAMAGASELSLQSIVHRGPALAWVAGLCGLVWFAPTTDQLMARYSASLEAEDGKTRAEPERFPLPSLPLRFSPSPAWALVFLGLSLLCLSTISRGATSGFIYYRF